MVEFLAPFAIVCMLYVFGKILELLGNLWKAFEPWRKFRRLTQTGE